ncbi:MAG: HEAT repeat domain-containing protein, partial [Chitinivibrionales bacterium]|nr:HEAT repeat domain-containing protein [Chitinivibrionales bacterium]
HMRIEVIQALSNIATASSAEFLITALHDDNPEIRACAAMALGQLRAPTAERPLKVLLTDPVEHVRRSAAMALGLIVYLPE